MAARAEDHHRAGAVFGGLREGGALAGGGVARGDFAVDDAGVPRVFLEVEAHEQGVNDAPGDQEEGGEDGEGGPDGEREQVLDDAAEEDPGGDVEVVAEEGDVGPGEGSKAGFDGTEVYTAAVLGDGSGGRGWEHGVERHGCDGRMVSAKQGRREMWNNAEETREGTMEEAISIAHL